MFLLDKENEKVLTVSTLSEDIVSSLFEKPNFYGIFFFLEADATVIIDQQKINIEDYHILFYYPYQKLSISGSYQGIFIQFHPNFFCIDIHAKDIGCKGLLFNNFFNDFLLICSKKEFEELSQFPTNLKKELAKNDIGKLDMVASQLKIFLINSVRFKLGKMDTKLHLRPDLHFQIEKLIEENYATQASPEFYAKELGVSLSKFNRLCKKYFHNSFISIVNLKKVANAKNKLFLTDASVKEIAYDLGFNDPLYFSRVFKRYSGISPKEFRIQVKNNRLL